MDVFQGYLSLPRRARVSFTVEASPDTEVRPARRWESKLGGWPYLPAGMGWPTRPVPAGYAQSTTPYWRVRAERDTEPLAFLAQVNLGELEAWRAQEGVPRLFEGQLPTRGMLQFFVAEEDGFGLDDRVDGWGRCYTRYLADVVEDDSALAPAEVLVTGDDGRLVFVPESRELERFPSGHVRSTDRGGETTPLNQARFPLRMTFTRRAPEEQLPAPGSADVPEALRQALWDTPAREAATQAGAASGGTQLGGYPYFTQADPRERDEGPERVLLFQLDSDGDGVTVGDSGVMGFFIPAEDLARGDLHRVGMSWDCL